MVYYLALFLLCWFLIFTAVRFLNFYKIDKDYKGQTKAKVTAAVPHVPENRREEKEKKKSIDVTLSYLIEGKEGSTEITVPAERAEDFGLDKEVPVRYMVSLSGAVHLASDNTDIRKLLIGHGIAFVVELIAFVIIWVQLI